MGAKIVRSMIQHCKEQESLGKCAWPDVIQFETCGICDFNEGKGTEKATVRQLEKAGYLLVLSQWMNTCMVRKKALANSTRIQQWLDDLRCDFCRTSRTRWPLTLRGDDFFYCRVCWDKHWMSHYKQKRQDEVTDQK